MEAARHHAIIGDGVVAAAFLAAIEVGPGDRLTLIGPTVSHFGAGRSFADHPAHAPWRFAYLLDRSSRQMDRDFAGWLAGQWSEFQAEIANHQPQHLRRWAGAVSAGDFGALILPRAIYGRFLAERTAGQMARLHEIGVQVRLVPGLATDLSRAGEKFRITLANGEVIAADRVDVATGGPANQRFGADAGPTAFTTLHGNEEAIAEVLQPGWEVTCLGASTEALDVMHYLRAAHPERELRLRVIRDGAAPQLDADPDYRRLREVGQIVEEAGTTIWAYAEAPGKVRLRLRRPDGQRNETTVPLAINTAGRGDQLVLDFLVSGMIAKGWLRLNTARTGLDLGPGFAGQVNGLRYASAAVATLGGQGWDAGEQSFQDLIGSFGNDPFATT